MKDEELKESKLLLEVEIKNLQKFVDPAKKIIEELELKEELSEEEKKKLEDSKSEVLLLEKEIKEREDKIKDIEKELKHRAIAIEIKKSFIKRIEKHAQCIVKDCSAKNTYKVDWLHFDHIAPETKNGRRNEINYMVKGRNKATLEDLLNEIHKTNLVCHVHHQWHTKMQQSLNPKYEYYMVTKDSIERVAELGNWRYSIFRKKKNDRIVLQAYQETLENEDLSKVVRWS